MLKLALLDKPLPYNLQMTWESAPDEVGVIQIWMAEFTAANGTQYRVDISVDAGSKAVILHIGFSQQMFNQETQKTKFYNKVMNTGDQYAVFATVYAVIVDVYQHAKKQFDTGQKFVINFSGDKRELSRTKLYDALCRKIAPKVGGTYTYDDGYFYVTIAPTDAAPSQPTP